MTLEPPKDVGPDLSSDHRGTPSRGGSSFKSPCRRQKEYFDWLMSKTGGKRPDFQALSAIAAVEFGRPRSYVEAHLYRAWLKFGRGSGGRWRSETFAFQTFEDFQADQERRIAVELDGLRSEVRVLEKLIEKLQEDTR